jgi:hypothetical protein
MTKAIDFFFNFANATKIMQAQPIQSAIGRRTESMFHQIIKFKIILETDSKQNTIKDSCVDIENLGVLKYATS